MGGLIHGLLPFAYITTKGGPLINYAAEIKDTEDLLRRLKAYKTPNGTRIHYATVKLARLKAKAPLIEDDVQNSRSKRSPRSPQRAKPVEPYRAKACPENRAYVLSREIYDLTQAIVALERLR